MTAQCCSCNSVNSKCIRCACVKRRTPHSSCLPSRTGSCQNTPLNPLSVKPATNTTCQLPPSTDSRSNSANLCQTAIVADGDAQSPQDNAGTKVLNGQMITNSVDGHQLGDMTSVDDVDNLMNTAYASTLMHSGGLNPSDVWCKRWETIIHLNGRHYALPGGSIGVSM